MAHECSRQQKFGSGDLEFKFVENLWLEGRGQGLDDKSGNEK
jgi:hypothetical protein